MFLAWKPLKIIEFLLSDTKIGQIRPENALLLTILMWLARADATEIVSKLAGK